MSASTDNTIEVVFVGGDIEPTRVRAQDLADILKATEMFVVSGVVRDRPDLKDLVIIALDSIQIGSVNLGFAPSFPEITMPAFIELGRAVETQQYDGLTGAARESLRQFAVFNRKYNCATELRTRNNGQVSVWARITSDLDIPPTPRVYGETMLYGQVVSAGGKDPNVHLQTFDGSEVICSGSHDLVKQLAGRLYSWVGVKGHARWDVDTLKVSDFRISEILPYEDTPITDAIDELAAAVSPHFDGIDVNAFMSEARGDTEE